MSETGTVEKKDEKRRALGRGLASLRVYIYIDIYRCTSTGREKEDL
jgi:hypothetical protein